MCLPVSTNPYFTVYKGYPYFQPYYCISLSVPVVFLCFTCSTLTLRNIGNSTQENQSSDKSVTSDANPARTFPGNDTGAVTTLSAGLGFLEASLDPEMKSGSKLDSDPETESGSVSLIAINFLLVLLSLSFYRSTVLLFSPSTQKETTVLPGADQLRRVQGEPSLDSPWCSRRAQPTEFRWFLSSITNLCFLFRPRTRPTGITACLLCCWLQRPGPFIGLRSGSSSTDNRTCPLPW